MPKLEYGVVIIISLWTLTYATFMQDALTENKSGSAVVENVIDLISRTCLVENEVFLRRWARVDSADGTEPETYGVAYSGGIWKIDEASFNMTKHNPSLQYAYNIIKSKLNIDWSNVTWDDLRKPINSGLAATLLMKAKHIRKVPENLEIQATVWSVLRPPQMAFQFVRKEAGIKIECKQATMLDLAFILDFDNLTPLDVIKVTTFIKSLLDHFSLSADATNVALVTKKIHPTVAWYFNSQAATGLTFQMSLPALTYQRGPTFIGDSLRFTREKVFNTTNGARSGAQKVAILFTDVIRDAKYAHAESLKLENAGVGLVVLQVSSLTTHDAEQLVTAPKCQNARTFTSFDDLTSVVERLTSEICRAPAILTSGDYRFRCGQDVTVRLPESSNAVIVRVSPDSGVMKLYAAKGITHPDEAHFDAEVTSEQALYIRGSDPMHIGVKGSTCTGSYTLHIRHTQEFRGVSGVCIIAGVVRPCSDTEMNVATHDAILVPDPDAPFLCDPRNNTIEIYPHPTDFHKFIMCDQNDNTFVRLCPFGVADCNYVTSGCKYSNPCTQQEILAGNMYQHDPCGNQTNYVICTSLGIAEVTQCPRTRIWNHDTLHCVFEYVHDPSIPGSGSIPSIANPCLHVHSDHVYFPYPGDVTKYIFCDQFGNAFARTCPGGIWNEQSKTCVSGSSLIG